MPSWNETSSPIGVASDRVPSLVLIDVDALHICLCVNVICAAGQSLEESSSIAPSVNPGRVVIPEAPHDAKTVTLHHTQVTTNLPPKPEERSKRYLPLKKKIKIKTADLFTSTSDDERVVALTSGHMVWGRGWPPELEMAH